MNSASEQEKFLAQAMMNAAYAFASGYPDGRLYVCNQAFCDLTGYTEEELRTINWAVDLTPPEWRELEAEKLAELHRTGKPQFYEKEYIRKNGSRVPIEISTHLVTDEAGHPAMYYAFVFDITTRKSAKQQAQILYDISRHLNQADDAAALLEAVIPTFVNEGGFLANMFYMDSDEHGQPAWAEIAAVWQREGDPLTPVGMRLHLPEFSFSELWLEDPEAPLYVSDITQDERVDQATRDFYTQLGLSATVVIPLAQALGSASGERWVGVISLNWREAQTFSGQTRAIYDAIPSLAAPAVESHRSAQAQAVARQRAETVAEISAEMARAMDEQEILTAIAKAVRPYGVAQSLLGYLHLDENGAPYIIETVAVQDGKGQPIPLSALPMTRMSNEEFPMMQLLYDNPDEPFFVKNVFTHPQTENRRREFFEAIGMAATIAIPLKTGAQWQGIIGFNWAEPQTFETELRALLTALQPRIADIVAGRRAYLAVRAARRRSDQIAQMNMVLSAATDAQTLLGAVARAARRYGVTLSILYYTDTDTVETIADATEAADATKATLAPPKALDIVAACGSDGQALPLETFPATHTALADFPLLQVMFTAAGNPVFIENIATDPRCADDQVRELAAASNVAASIMLPLRAGDAWQGAITLNWDTPQIFDDEMRVLLTAFVPTASTVVARSRLVDNLEQLVAERRARVQENERFLHQIIDTIPDLIYVKDAEGRYVLANQALADVFDTTTEAVIGKSDADLGLSEELNQEYLAINRKVRETKQPFSLPEHTVFDPETQEKRFYQSTILPIISGDGEAHQVVGVSVNITDRKQIEQEREHMQQEIIEAQRQALQELSTPVIPVMDRILVMPLVGSIDTMRARDIMRALLESISDHRAKVVILDVTGVPIMDTGIVNHINKTIQAARLKGAQTIVTGISDAVAEAIVDLGIDWGAVETLSDLRTGLVVALDRLGVRLTTDKETVGRL